MKNNKKVLLNLDENLLKRLDDLRWALHLNRSDLIRLALKYYCTKREGESSHG